MASPIWRSMLITAEPVANECDGSARGAGRHQRRQREADADAGEDHAAEHLADVVGLEPLRERPPGRPGGEDRRARRDHRPRRRTARSAGRRPGTRTAAPSAARARSPGRCVSADQCQTSCIHSTRESSIAPNAAENSSATTDAPVNGRSANSARSISGLRARTLCSANSAERDRARAERGERPRRPPSPSAPPLTRPSDERADPAGDQQRAERVGRRAPDGPGTCGSRRQPTTSAARPIGTLTRNTQRQLAATSTRRPPGRARRPGRRPRSTRAPRRGGAPAGVVARIRPSEVGVSSAAPAACTTRNATSIGRLRRGAARRRRGDEQRHAEQERRARAGSARPAGRTAPAARRRRSRRRSAPTTGPRAPSPPQVEVARHLRQRDVDDEQVEAGEHDARAHDHQHELGRCVAAAGAADVAEADLGWHSQASYQAGLAMAKSAMMCGMDARRSG